jgi:D-alanine-D-alanine ligase
MLDVPYVGNGVLASAVAMDKHFAKQIFKAHGINVAPGVALRKGDEIKDHGLGYPLFVKPARGGSSRGTHKVKRAEDLISAVNDAFKYDNKVMLEQAVVGREIECAVLEKDGKVQCSVPGEIQIDSKFEFYDFEAKYLDGATTRNCSGEYSTHGPITRCSERSIYFVGMFGFSSRRFLLYK